MAMRGKAQLSIVPSPRRAVRGLMTLVLAASGGLLAYLGWRSLGWPLIHDAPLMHYIAWVIGQGGVPYRDVFDMNLPGAYLIHAAAMAVGGDGDLGWRLFDLGWLAATGALLWVYARPVGDGPAAAGAILFGLYHLSGGAWRAGQRDFLLCLFLIAGAWGIARSIERDGAVGPLVAAGLALGAGITVKPHAGLYWLGGAAVAAWSARRARRSPVAAAGPLLAAGLAVPALAFGWLWMRGGLGAFVDVLTGYLIPLYSRVGRVSSWQILDSYRYGKGLWALLGALALVALVRRAPSGAQARKVLAALGAGYGVLHVLVQGKGWEYHFYPPALFVCALAPFALRGVSPAASGGAGAWPAWAARGAALALLAWITVVLGVKGVEAIEPRWIADKAARVAAVTRDLARLAPDGAPVQVMDVTEGGIHALWKLGRRQPTRFIYDFHFFHDVSDPRIQALRGEFLHALAGAPPSHIVIFRDTWNREGYQRLRDWPALERFLDRSYALAVDGDGYRIYARRTDS
jgi:hypothetical protein